MEEEFSAPIGDDKRQNEPYLTLEEAESTERKIPPINTAEPTGQVLQYEDSESEEGEAATEEFFDSDFSFEDPEQKRKSPKKSMGGRGEPRIKLGIEGLDEMLGGGLIRNSVTGIIGTYGTGKTTFAINFIFEGLKKGETCILISLDERADMLKESIKRRGYDLDTYMDKTFYLIKLDPTDFTLAINSIKDEIPSLIRETKASRIVIDPISLFEGLLPDEASRRIEMFRFVERMRDENCTLLLTSETDTQIPYASKYGLVEYLVDCVILLRYVRASDLSGTHLAVEVVKMRRSQHSREIKPYEIQPDDVVVYSEASVF